MRSVKYVEAKYMTKKAQRKLGSKWKYTVLRFLNFM